MANLRTRLSSVPTPEQSYDALFGNVSSSMQIATLRISDLEAHPLQKTIFSRYSLEKLEELTQNIKLNGVLSPIIVRPMPSDEQHPYKYYQILAGHRRVQGSDKAGLETIPAIIRDVDDDTANLIFTDTNLNQREQLLPSEKALAYKLQTDSLKNLGTNGPSVSIIAEQNGTTRKEIYRYIRLTELIPTLLQLVDDSILPFRVGVNLSYLTTDEQEIIDAYLSENKVKISVEQSENIKKYSKEIAPITYAVLNNMFKPAKTVKTTERKLKFSKPALNKVWSYIPDTLDDSEVQNYILKALIYYHNNQ
ncbi:ParB family chromosome partitioning protein [Hydrogenoanaerobacterium saccharovorans]|uniref:Chromosome partitioning protein, ParB family n=1 Tax=Hydrogenoanaerobacterium saccharovorans TaxID=474960 RepID=A0A1H8AXE2_9FIRM|nr:ParB/RepB/Spo0J family partition protein [Hydrogenoanaerobacterium saccharovorans]RPF47730.1 ParB family chromosome partitioning protein [Hydrogenoanaerobacterium saccharovorans]SEM74594.1 chromosome partitioning protein, ParB family [Hydrogenoanaerobacterium saccharovorans]